MLWDAWWTNEPFWGNIYTSTFSMGDEALFDVMTKIVYQEYSTQIFKII